MVLKSLKRLFAGLNMLVVKSLLALVYFFIICPYRFLVDMPDSKWITPKKDTDTSSLDNMW